MQVIEPSSYQREQQLLPGSEEKRNKEVSSLEELKRELNEANDKENQRTRIINKAIVAGSILAVLFLLLGPKTKNPTSWSKALKILGYALSIGLFIKGAAGVSSQITVIDPEGNVEEKDVKYSESPTSKRSRLIRLGVKATADVIINSNIEPKNLIKKKCLSLTTNKDKGNSPIIKELINYGRSL